MTPEEIAKLAGEELRKVHEEFKRQRDKEVEEIKAIGQASTETKATLEKLQAALDATEKKQKAALDEIEKKMNRLALGGAGVEADDEAKAKRREYKAAMRRYYLVGADGLSDVERKTLTKSDDTGGGYLAPDDLDTEILKNVVLISDVRSLVSVRQTSRQAVRQPKLTNAPAMAQKVSETGARVESTNPSYGAVEIPTAEYYAVHKISHQALEDSAYNVEAELAEFIGWQFGLREGYNVVKGNGVGEARGFLDAGAGVASVNSGSAAAVADANGRVDGIISLIHDLKEAYAKNGVFVLNRKTLGSIRKLKDGQGRYLWEPSVQVGQPPTILGYRYAEMPDMPDEAANATPVAFGDFRRAYKFVDRLQSSILRDPYTSSDNGLVKFTVYRRHGGDVVLAEAIRLLKCAA